jgi:hypothetical protein
MRASEFARRRARILKETNQHGRGDRRRAALRALVKRSGARPIYSRRQVIAYRLPDGSVACVWLRFRTGGDALDELVRIRTYPTHDVVPVRAYACDLCGGWHLAR